MGLEICKNHAGRKAVGHCATCHIPLCEECALKTPSIPDRMFCSQEHAQQFLSFVEADGGKIKRLRKPSFIKNLFMIAIAIVTIYLVLHLMGLFVPNLGLPFYGKFKIG